VKWRTEVKMGRHLAEKVLWMMYMTVFWSGSRSILELICPFAYLAPLQASLIRRISDCRNRTMNLVGMQVTNCKGKNFFEGKKKQGQTELIPWAVLHRNLAPKQHFLQISFHVFLWVKRWYSANSYKNRNPIVFLQNSYESKEAYMFYAFIDFMAILGRGRGMTMWALRDLMGGIKNNEHISGIKAE
jgi:hypothetical protein